MKTKNLWKALGIAAAAALIPVRFKRDESTGKKTYQSLLCSLDVGPGEDDVHTDIGISLGEGLLTNVLSSLFTAKKERELFTDDPAEAVLFADDEPEAAVIPEAEPEEAAAPAEEEEAPAGEESTEATEEDFDPDL